MALRSLSICNIFFIFFRSQDELPAVSDSKMSVKLSASDISDAELPASQSEKESSDDLEDLEKARAELQAKLAAAGISDDASEETSEGEITSDVQIKQSEETHGEKVEEKSASTEDEEVVDDHEQAKKKSVDKDNSPKDPDDSNGAPGAGKIII